MAGFWLTAASSASSLHEITAMEVAFPSRFHDRESDSEGAKK
jgi:hypothetical protein